MSSDPVELHPNPGFRAKARQIANVPGLGFIVRWGADLARLPIIHLHLARHVEEAETQLQNNNALLHGVDSRLSIAEAGIQSANARIEKAESGLHSIDPRIDTAESGLRTLGSSMGRAESGLQRVASRVETAESGLLSFQSRLEMGESALQGVRSRIETGESALQSVQFRVETAESALHSVQSRVEMGESALQGVQSRVETAESGLQSTGLRLESAESLLKEAGDLLETNRPAWQKAQNRLASLEANANSLYSTNCKLRDDLVHVGSDIATLQADLEALRKENASLKSKIVSFSSLESATLRLRLEIKDLQSKLQELAVLSSRWDSTESFVSKLQALGPRLGIEGDLEGVLARVAGSIANPDGRSETNGEQPGQSEQSLAYPQNSASELEAQRGELPHTKLYGLSSDSAASKQSRLVSYIGSNRVLTKTQRGIFLVCSSDDLEITPQVLSEGVWEPITTALYERLLPAGGSYLEIGANIGYFTSLAATHIGHRGFIYAFEPNPAAFSLLEANLRINHQTYLATLRQLAVTDKPGVCSFNSFKRNIAASTFSNLDPILLDEMKENADPIQVSCTTLDAEFADSDRKFDFVKIDAEGSEPLIITGATKFLQRNVKPTTVMILEWNPVAMRGLNADGEALLNTLRQQGFQIFKIQSVELLAYVASGRDLEQWCLSELIATRSPETLIEKGLQLS